MFLGKVVRCLWIVVLVGWLMACGSDNRQQARIPPLPASDDSSRTQAALRALTAAINQSAPASAYARWAALYLSAGRVREALDDIDEAISLNNNEGSYYLIKAEVHRALQQPGKALENAQRAEILGVDTPALYTLIGDLLQQRNQFGRAQLYIAKALQMAPYDGEAYFYNGLMAAKLGDTVQALTHYHRALQLKPKFLNTYEQLSAVHRSRKELDLALNYTERALAYHPRNARLHLQRGLAYQAFGRADSALVSFQRAVKWEPNLYQAYYHSGIIFQRFRNYRLALDNFTRVQKLNPRYPGIQFLIGYCLEQTGQWEPAIAAYTKAIQTNPSNRQAQIGIWRVQRRQMGMYDYGTGTEDEVVDGADQPSAPSPVLDTSRVRIITIQPKTRISTGTDSLRRSISPVGSSQ